MKKKLDIPKDFWKDFKDRKDFNLLTCTNFSLFSFNLLIWT